LNEQYLYLEIPQFDHIVYEKYMEKQKTKEEDDSRVIIIDLNNNDENE
jgi:hypothetical protein